jgi:hypothetical protein
MSEVLRICIAESRIQVNRCLIKSKQSRTFSKISLANTATLHENRRSARLLTGESALEHMGREPSPCAHYTKIKLFSGKVLKTEKVSSPISTGKNQQRAWPQQKIRIKKRRRSLEEKLFMRRLKDGAGNRRAVQCLRAGQPGLTGSSFINRLILCIENIH